MTSPIEHIFISYRRTDESPLAERLTADLGSAFGPERLAADFSYAPGASFPDALRSEVKRAAVVLVLIGPSWLSSADEFHRRRIDLADDWVRSEVSTGLRSSAVVIPVLMQGAALPPRDALPHDIASLAEKQAFRLDTDNWQSGVHSLVESISSYTGWASTGAEVDGAGLHATVGTRLFGSRPPLVRDFYPRPELELLDGPDAVVISAVHGIGGVGKSQLAAKYFQDQQSRYDFAAWVDMRDQSGNVDYEGIAAALDLDLAVDDIVKAVRNAIEHDSSSWLLVFDNAERPEEVLPLVPEGQHVKVLITSRSRSWGSFARIVSVDILPEMAAAQLLSDLAGQPNDEDALQLADLLGRLPLALSLAGSQCAAQSLSFREYINNVLPPALRAGSPRGAAEHDQSIALLLEASFEAVEGTDRDAASLATVLAFLDWTHFDRDWLRAIHGSSARRLDRQLGVLSAYSIVDLTEQSVAIKHSLIADGLTSSEPEPRVADRLVDVLVDSVPDPNSSQESLVAAAEPVRHLRRLLLEHPKVVPDRLIGTLLQAGYASILLGEPAADFHEALVQLCLNRFGSSSPESLNALTLLGMYYSNSERHEDAINIETQVLRDSERVLGPEHPDTIAARANLAASYYESGMIDRAIDLERRVLDDSRGLYGPDHPNTISARANLATSYSQAGLLDDAMALNAEVLSDNERILGDLHPNTLASRANLATTYRHAGRLDEAIAMDEQVLADFDSVLGPSHPNTLTARANLAFSYWQAGRVDEAIQLEEQVLADRQRILGPDHPDTLTSMANLAVSYSGAGRVDEAIPIEEQVLAGRQRVLGPDHPGTLTSMANLAVSYSDAGRMDRAIQLEEQVLADRQRILGPAHPDTAASRQNLARSYRNVGRDSDADALERNGS